MTETKKYSTPQGANTSKSAEQSKSEHVEKILNAPVTNKSEPMEEKPLTLTQTVDLSLRSISDVITLLESLPHVEGRLPDKIIKTIGKLNGAINFLR